MKIAVIGAGSYGTCLAKHLGDQGYDVTLWCRNADTAQKMQSSRENSAYLPGFVLPKSIVITSQLSVAVADRQLVLGVTPVQVTREVFTRVAEYLPADAIVVNASKGLETGTFKRIDEIYSDVLPTNTAHAAAFLSGPTFAREIAANMPSAMVVASREDSSSLAVQEVFCSPTLRVYSSEDIIGVQIGGALKNIIAILAGLCDGLGYGQNARAGLITRGLAEISRIGVAMGADPLTFLGLSGVGDLVLTCAGDMSRNRQVGLALGSGKNLDDIVSDMNMVAEGVKTAAVAWEWTQTMKVDAPLTSLIYEIMYRGLDPIAGVQGVMARSQRRELD